MIQEIDQLAFIDPIEFIDPETGNLLDLQDMSEHARKSIQEITAIAGKEDGFKILTAKWGKDRGRYIDMLGKFHRLFEDQNKAGIGIIIVQQYCEMDAHL